VPHAPWLIKVLPMSANLGKKSELNFTRKRKPENMLKINRANTKLERMTRLTLVEAEILERQGLQKMIVANSDAFFEEINEKLLLIGQEIRPSEKVGDRIDLLALDESGNSVIIELKRSEDRLQLLQAISYAAMISDWKIEGFVEQRSMFLNESVQEARDAISEHFGKPSEEEIELSNVQRIILIAENFDFALLKSAEWLVETYDVDIRCFRIEYTKDDASEYLSCVCVYPPINYLESADRIRRRIASAASEPQNWHDFTEKLKNQDVRNFFRKDWAGGEKSGGRSIAFRINGARRISVSARSNHAYVWQTGRFDGDEAFWRERISEPESVREVDNNRSLSMRLTTALDFDAFEAAIKQLERMEFKEPIPGVDEVS
jgi:hypothetical protein